MASSSTTPPGAPPPESLLPPVPRATSIIVIGMAGSGKSTFTSALASYHADADADADAGAQPQTQPYMVNLDPAVASLGYDPNVDIRDTVDYRRVMQQYHLGPNGGILTALNLFTTKFDQVLGILENRAKETDHILIDTPGQIEIFTWSASGTIVTDALASAMPTVVAYVIDTPRTTAPATFMSNMLYACSILYKTKLPFILVFNKTDAQPHDFALEWMHDFEKFQEALREGNATDPSPAVTGGSGASRSTEEAGYMNSLMNSMSLVLDEFYKNLRTVGVSSLTGTGLPSFFEAVSEARQEYLTDYRPELERLAAQRRQKRDDDKRRQLEKLLGDMRVADSQRSKQKEKKEEEDEEEEEVIEEEYEGDGQIVEPDSDEEKPHYDYPGPAYDRGDGSVWPRPG